MNINKSQAKLLASQFLDNQNTDSKNTLVPKETLSEIFLIAGDFIANAQGFLTKHNASGNLSSSLEVIDPSKNGCKIQMDYYGQFLNDGVKGVKSGSGKYAFKTLNPSPGMIKSLLKNIKSSGKKVKNTNAQKTTSRNENKNIDVSKVIAWGAAVNIKKKGIKAVHFIDNAAKQTTDELESRLSKAFRIDILNSLPPSI